MLSHPQRLLSIGLRIVLTVFLCSNFLLAPCCRLAIERHIFGCLGVFLLILQSLKDDFDDARAQNLSDDARLPNMNVVLGVKTKHRCNLELAQIKIVGLSFGQNDRFGDLMEELEIVLIRQKVSH